LYNLNFMTQVNVNKNIIFKIKLKTAKSAKKKVALLEQPLSNIKKYLFTKATLKFYLNLLPI
jgi:hypothetical protein